MFSERIDRTIEANTSNKKRRKENAQQRKALDDKFRNNTELRQKRLNALSSLTFEPSVPLLTAAGESSASTKRASTAVKDTDDSSTATTTQTQFNESQQCYICKRYFVERYVVFVFVVGAFAVADEFGRGADITFTIAFVRPVRR